MAHHPYYLHNLYRGFVCSLKLVSTNIHNAGVARIVPRTCRSDYSDDLTLVVTEIVCRWFWGDVLTVSDLRIMLGHSWTGSSKSNSSRGTGETKSCCHTGQGQQFIFFAKHQLPTMSPLVMSEHVNGCVWIMIAVLKIGGLLPSSLKRSLQTKWWFIVSGFFLFPFYNLFFKKNTKILFSWLMACAGVFWKW